MTKKNFLLNAFLLTLASACAHTDQRAAGLDSRPREKASIASTTWSAYEKRAAKTAPVDVEDCQAQDDQVCIIKVDPAEACDPTRKPKPPYMRVHPGQHVVWHVVGSNWDFDGPGIRFINPGAPFTAQGAGPNVRHWKVNQNAPSGTVWEYHVLLAKGSLKCEIDPGLWV